MSGHSRSYVLQPILECVCYCCRHQEYIVDGMQYMRMKFYVDGSKRKGTVHLDMKKVRGGQRT